MTREIPLTRGYVALVDDDDYEAVMAAGSWWAHVEPRGHTVYALGRPHRTRRKVPLHRFISGYSYVDHVNGDGLDNRRSNLRPATQRENVRNIGLPRDNTSGFKGVSYHKRDQVWYARISVDGERARLGSFRTAEEAARAYDTAARELHGEFACVNFPRPGERGAA